MHYSDNQLRELLNDSPIGDFRPDELVHLEQCNSCQQRLAKLSGAGDWLNDLTDRVNEPTSDFHLSADESPASIPYSVLVAVDSSERQNRQIECEPVHLDFLDSPTHPELLGRLGRYDIERLIGVGGFGIVFKARDSELNRVVAIKVLAPHLVHSGPARQRFAREAQASAAVVHEHVVPIHDVVSTDNICYLVMQYIPGSSLQERVDEQGPLPTAEVLRIGSQAAAGLHAAHKQGIIHRDVKPGNVLLEDSVDRVLISDFGLARAADDASLTRSGVITGTPNYMSPEQARGAAIDVRSDLFSLGSVLYFMCSGRSPFRAPNMMAVMNRICHESYRPLDEINPNLPGELIDLIDRLLAKSPDERFQDAQSVKTELSSLLGDFQSGKLRPRRAAEATWTDKTKVAFAGLMNFAPAVFRSAIVAAALFLCLLAGRYWFPKVPFSQLTDSGDRIVIIDDKDAPRLLEETTPLETSPLNQELMRAMAKLRFEFRKMEREEVEFQSALMQSDALLDQMESNDWNGNNLPAATSEQWRIELECQSLERELEQEDCQNKKFEEFLANPNLTHETECSDCPVCTDPKEGDEDESQ